MNSHYLDMHYLPRCSVPRRQGSRTLGYAKRNSHYFARYRGETRDPGYWGSLSTTSCSCLLGIEGSGEIRLATHDYIHIYFRLVLHQGNVQCCAEVLIILSIYFSMSQNRSPRVYTIY